MELTCATAPGVIFTSEDDLKTHYRSDLHRFNLKRRGAGMLPLTADDFQERVCAAEKQQAEAVAASAKGDRKGMTKQQKLAAKMAAKREGTVNPKSRAAEAEKRSTMTPEEYMAYRLTQGVEYAVEKDLFSSHVSESLEANLKHMFDTHGFFIPFEEYVTDVPGLVHYLGWKVYMANMSLWTDKQFIDLEAVQAHMRAKSHCRMNFDDHEDDFEDYYDFERMQTDGLLADADGEGEVEVDGLDLVLADGRRLGHRSLRAFYRQKLRPVEMSDAVAAVFVERYGAPGAGAAVPMSGSGRGGGGSALMVSTSSGVLVAAPSRRKWMAVSRSQKHDKVEKIEAKYSMKMGIKNNKLSQYMNRGAANYC